jgi:hypothetical protein
MDVLVRKGGILEQKDGFKVEHREFYLFPTYLHQKAEALNTEFQKKWDDLKGAAPSDHSVCLELHARVLAVHEIKNLEDMKPWAPRHIYSEQTVFDRFHYKNNPGLHVLELKVEVLEHPIILPNSSAYDGCLSWVELMKQD